MIMIDVRKIQPVRELFDFQSDSTHCIKNCDLLCSTIHHSAAPTSLLVEQLQYTKRQALIRHVGTTC